MMMIMMMRLPHHEVAGAGVEVRVVVPLLPGPHTGSQQLPASLIQELISAQPRQTWRRCLTIFGIESTVV